MCATARCPTPFKKSFIAIQNHSKTIQKLSKAHEQAHGTLQTHAHGQAHQHAASKSSTSTRTATLLFTLQSLDTVHWQAGKDGSTTTFRRQEGWIGRMVVHTLQTALGAWWGQETCTINLHMNTQLAQSMFRVFQDTEALLPMSPAHLSEHARGQYRKARYNAELYVGGAMANTFHMRTGGQQARN